MTNGNQNQGGSERELNNLSEANKLGKERKWEFNEWLLGKTGRVKGAPFQAWSAGAFVYALECFKNKKVLFFS